MSVRELSSVPSFPAIWAAALGRPPLVPRATSLPERRYRVRGVKVGAEQSARFDHLVGAAASDYVHPGLLHVLAFPVSLSLMAHPRFPFPLLGLVHVKNSILQHRPVRVGEVVDVECSVRNIQPHRRGATFEAVSTLSADGQIVATDVSTYLARGETARKIAALQEEGASADGSRSEDRAAKREEFQPPKPSARWKLNGDTGRRYAAVAGDANPIHMSALSAKAFGFPKAIAHGMYTASRAFAEARPDLSVPLKWDVEFAAPVLIPGTVWLSFENDDSSRVYGARGHAGGAESGSAAGAGSASGGGRRVTRFTGFSAPKPDRPSKLHFTGTVELFG